MQMQALVLLAVLAGPSAAANLPGLHGAPIKMIYDPHTTGLSPECNHASKESGYFKRNNSKVMFQSKRVKQMYFINRKESFKRHNHMMSECRLNAKGIPCKKFTAVEAEKDIPTMDLKQYSSGKTTDWMKGATKSRQHIFMAIFLSNVKAIQNIADSDPDGIKNDDIYLIMEDDSTIGHDFHKKIRQILDHTPDDWQTLRLGFWGKVRCEDRVNLYVGALQYPSVDKKALGNDHFYSGNQGYLVRGSAIPEILSIMKEHDMGAIENAFMYPSTQGRQIISYVVAPEMRLLGMTHDGIEGASKKQDKPRGGNFKKHGLLETKSKKTFLSGNRREQDIQAEDTWATSRRSRTSSRADAVAFIEAREQSHPRQEVKECLPDIKKTMPQFSQNMSTYNGTKKFLYISVNKMGSRSSNMQNLIKSQSFKLPALRVQGYTKQDITKGLVDVSEFSNGKVAEYMADYSPHTRLVTTAIFMSHARALKTVEEAIDENTDPNQVFIILEDDAWFEAGWEKKLQTLIEHTPDDWDMLKLGYWGNRHCVDKVNHYIYQANAPTYDKGTLFYQGNTGYAVRAGSVNRILTALKQNPLMDVDGSFLTDNGLGADCTGTCLKVYAASMKKVFIVDRNLGTFRADLKGKASKKQQSA